MGVKRAHQAASMSGGDNVELWEFGEAPGSAEKKAGMTAPEESQTDTWQAVRQAVNPLSVVNPAEINRNLPGGLTWKLIVEERLISANKLRERLLDMWTLMGVVTALVASFAVDGITNSAQSFESYAAVTGSSGNESNCLGGGCVNIRSLYQAYGTMVSIGCLMAILALAMSMLFYSYLLIQPVGRTRAFVRKNVHLFPSVFAISLLAMFLVSAAVCVQCIAAFGKSIGYPVAVFGAVCLVFILWMVFDLERETRSGLERFSRTRRRKLAQTMADVVNEARKKEKATAAAAAFARKAKQDGTDGGRIIFESTIM